MKKNILLLLFSVILNVAFSQSQTERKIITKPFTALVAGGASDISLIKGEEYLVVVDAPEHIQDKINVAVSGKTLTISYKNIKLKKNEDLKFYITVPFLNNINVSGASDLKSADVLTSDKLNLMATGAAAVDLDIDVNDLKVNVSGAAAVTLRGKVNNQTIIAGGAADYTAKELVSDTAVVTASGASTVYVNVLHKIDYSTSGAASVGFVGNPEMILRKGTSVNSKSYSSSGTSATTVYSSVNDYSDTVKVKIGSIDIEVVDEDTVTIRFGGHQLKVDENGNVKWEAVKKPKFNGHWGGVEMGINGYLTSDFNSKWGKEYDYLNLRYEKSWFVNLNVWEQNIPFNKNKTIGMITGVGMSWNNYKFSNDTYLVSDSATLKGYYMVPKSYYSPDSIYVNEPFLKKSKLTNMYINVPVLFEFQTKNPSRYKRFHVTVGGVIGVRVLTHTKVYFNRPNEQYKLQDPYTGNYLPQQYITPNNDRRNIVKEHDSFYQQPFKFDARVSVGYGWLNIFGTYTMNQMFQKEKGPKLYQWTLGLTLVGW
jgi:hypothetical protein